MRDCSGRLLEWLHGVTMSLYEGLEVETAPLPEISIGSITQPTSVSTSGDASEGKKSLSKLIEAMCECTY